MADTVILVLVAEVDSTVAAALADNCHFRDSCTLAEEDDRIEMVVVVTLMLLVKFHSLFWL